MYLMYSDESNLEAQDNTFFIYGGIIIDADKAKDLSDKVQRIRGRCGIPSTFVLKFKPKPSGIEETKFIECKQKIIQAAIDSECYLSLSLIHHGVARNPVNARRNEINRVAYHFNCFLRRKGSVRKTV